MSRPQKCVLLGLDSVNLDLVKKYADQGYLPNLKKMMDEGAITETFPAIPTGTAMNWTCIATGATIGTHGIAEMTLHLPGTSLSERFQSFDTRQCQAEYLWNAAERQGKENILLRYTASWPPTINQGLQVDGLGNPDWYPDQIAPRLGFSTEKMPQRTMEAYGAGPKEIARSVQVSFEPAQGWKNVPHSQSPALEATLSITPRGGQEKQLFCLLLNREGGGYDTLLLAEAKNAAAPLAELTSGQWSEFLTLEFVTSRGREKGNFRAKLIELSPNAERFRLYTTQILPDTGWTFPEELSRELTEHIGRPYQLLCDIYSPILGGWIDSPTYLEEVENQMTWLAEAARYLLTTKPWDMFYAQWHGIDYTDHCYLGGMDPESSSYRASRAAECEEAIRKVYQMGDAYVGAVMEAAGDDALICVVSDHGHMAPRKVFHCNNFLARHGLVAYRTNDDGSVEVDWAKTKVFSPFGSYVYVNLAGRESDGAVPPEQFEQVRDHVIDLFRNLKDPLTGENVVNMVLRREEAGFLGQHGERVGDICYTLNPRYNDETAWVLSEGLPVIDDPPYSSKEGIYPFAGVHHTYLPTVRQNLGAMKAICFLKGPGAKKGYQRKEAAHTIDVTPTLAYAMGIEPPRDAEGAILDDMLDLG